MKRIMMIISLLAIISMLASFGLIGCKDGGTEVVDTGTEEAVEEEAVEEEAVEEEVEEEVVEEEGITDEPITLNMWLLSGPAEVQLWQSVTDKYTSEHPNVTFNLVTQGSKYLRTNLPIAVATGKEDMDFFQYWASLGQKMAARGLVADISEYYEKYGWWDKLKPELHKAFQAPDGNAYFFNYGYFPMNVVWYNKEIFEEIGAEEPTTIEEMLDIARDAKAAGYEGISTTAMFFKWDLSNFASIYMSEEEKEFFSYWPTMTLEERANGVEMWKTSEGMRDIFEFIEAVGQEGLWAEGQDLLNYAEALKFFGNGGSAMHSVGSWMAAQWPKFTETGESDHIGVFPWPEGKIPEFYSNCVGIPAYTAEKSPEKVEVIADLLNSILTEEYAIIIQESGFFPSSTAFTSEVADKVSNPLMKNIRSDMDEVGVEFAVHWGMSSALEVAWSEAASMVSVGDMTVDEALESIYNVAIDDVDDPAWQ